VAATDVPIVVIASGATTNTYNVGVDAVSAGSFIIKVRNESGTSQSEALVLNYNISKGSNN
jgi:hypothetical protein